jgi:hypothetical protein
MGERLYTEGIILLSHFEKLIVGHAVKADPINIALVLLVFANTLAVVQFQALATSNPLGTSKVSTIQITREHISATVRPYLVASSHGQSQRQ